MNGIDDTLESALKHAYKLLGYRDRSEKEMHDKLLLKGFSRKVADETIGCLKEKGFINDAKLAEALKRDAVERQCLGRRGVRMRLVKRGISSAVADELSSGEEDEYIAAARKLVEKRLEHMKHYDEATIKRRLRGLLARRGFSVDSIREVMKSLNMEEES